jgi:HD-GYP domain-containing protein (c-di-GMP phosphodiesterase class II)
MSEPENTPGRSNQPRADDAVVEAPREKVRRLELLHRIGIAVSAERDKDRLFEMILLEAKALCGADGGTLYIRDGDHLRFAILRTDSLQIALGGTTGEPIRFPSLPLFRAETGEPNLDNVATAAAVLKRSVNIPDAYHAQGFDFSGPQAFDARNNYRSQSFLTIPMVNSDEYVIGVLQLINATDPKTGERVPFTLEQQQILEAVASQAAIALDNQFLIEAQKNLLESFIQMMASAIDAKSPYTGSHCERVPVLTEMIARSLCQTQQGPFAGFSLSREDWYELRIAAWLHDVGKVTTPVHVMDKSTKLETIFDRIELVRTRFGLLRWELELELRTRLAEPGADPDTVLADYHRQLGELGEELEFLEKANQGTEFLSAEAQAKIKAIGQRTFGLGANRCPLLTEEEINNLTVSRGTLNAEERSIINQHMVHTIKMLEALPFPRNLKRVPEYAAGHHEKMDGTGYPRGAYAGDLSLPARIMAIADVFEALTAQDRPYRRGVKLSEAMRIMGAMKRDNHLDPELFDHFVRSGVYRDYARRFLPEELVDGVDEAQLLGITPRPFTLPSPEERDLRRRTLLPEYAAEGMPADSSRQPR